VTVDLVPQTGPTVERVQKLTALVAAGSPLDLGDGPLGVRAMVAQALADSALDALIKRDKYDTRKYNQAHFQGPADGGRAAGRQDLGAAVPLRRQRHVPGVQRQPLQGGRRRAAARRHLQALDLGRVRHRARAADPTRRR
jgi:hypothetical protein